MLFECASPLAFFTAAFSLLLLFWYLGCPEWSRDFVEAAIGGRALPPLLFVTLAPQINDGEDLP